MTEPPAPAATAAKPHASTLPLRLGLAFFVAILAVSTASVLIRFAQHDAPSLVIAALRISTASLVLAPWALLYHRDELFSLTFPDLALALLSGLFLAVHFATWITSLEYTTVASSVVFVSTGPLWVALVSPLLLKEHLSHTALLGLGLALLGGIIVGLSDACKMDGALTCSPLSVALEGTAMWGNFLALAGAWAVTGYLVIGRKLRTRMSLIPYIFLVYGMAAVGLIIIMLAAGESPFGFQPMTYFWIALLALLPQLVGHSTYNWALRYAPASMVATVNLGEPVGSAILAYFILGEHPTAFIIAGGLLILTGIYLASRQSIPETRREAA